MTTVRETNLPGVGVKHDFTTEDGREVGVLVHKNGRRDIVVYDASDPDRCAAQINFSPADTRTLTELLGASVVTEAVLAVQQQIEGLAIEWITLAAGSPAVGRTIGDGEFRSRTGVSIVAVLRAGSAIPAPGPDFALEPADVVVAIGTVEGITAMSALIAPG